MAQNRKDSRVAAQAVAIPWFSRESYAACLAIFEDATDLPDTFDDWIAIAERVEQEQLRSGVTVVRAEIEPDAFRARCAARHHAHIDRNARLDFANRKALEWIEAHRESG